MIYNMNMKKTFRSRTTKKTKIKLTPKGAEEFIREEFTDSRGNKHIFIMDFKPHSPKKPTIEGTVEYKDKNKDKNKDK